MHTKKKMLGTVIEIALIAAWGFSLRNTEAAYFPYLVLAGLSAAASVQHYRQPKELPVRICVEIAAVSVVFAAAMMCGQYPIFTDLPQAGGLMRGLAVFIGSFAVCGTLFRYGYTTLRHKTLAATGHPCKHRALLFAGSALVFAGLHLTNVWLCKYPGEIQYDTLWQLNEILTGNYTNHHSIYHTFMLQACMEAAQSWGHGWTTGFFIYSVLQVLLVSLVVGYVMLTLNDMRLPTGVQVLVYLIFLLHPLHIKTVTYILKDAFFSFCALLFITALVQILWGLGTRMWIHWILLVVGALGFCIFRSNGFLAFLLTFLVFLFTGGTHENKRRVAVVLAAVMLAAVFLKGPMLHMMGVKKTEFTEKLSIPCQQIARVIYDGNALTEEEIALVDKAISIKYIKTYQPRWADPIKGLIQFLGKDSYVEEHKWEYLKLWISLGVRYPQEYMKAFVDQTVGYWMAGYGEGDMGYVPYKGVEGLMYTDLGKQVRQETRNNALYQIVNEYCHLFQNNGILYIFVEIGLHFWILIYLFVISLWKKNGMQTICTPGIGVILTLIVASPLWAEQRYAYAVYTTMIMAAVCVFYQPPEGVADDRH